MMSLDGKRLTVALAFAVGLLASACGGPQLEASTSTAPRPRSQPPRVAGHAERHQYYADEGRSLLVGWRSRDCLGRQASWGVSSPHETRVSSPCPDEAPVPE